MIRFVPAAVLVLYGLMLSACDQPPEEAAFDLNAALGGVADSGFERAINPKVFEFPADHAAHPGFRNEWWYVTGNVDADNGQHFGYQVTFFRIALSSPSDQQPPCLQESATKGESGPSVLPFGSAQGADRCVARGLSGVEARLSQHSSQWKTHQLWMAHVALTDNKGQQHHHDQRFARGAAGLAGQENNPFRVWLEDWQITGGREAEFPWAVTMKTDGFSLNLQLTPEKPVVLQGDAGLSRKSSGAGNASYYYSLTRLATSGELYLGDQRFVVNGQSWLDREWSTSVLGDDQVGWDWFSLQLDSGDDVMLYQLRNAAGEADAYSAGKWVQPDGQSESMNMQGVEFKPLRTWCHGKGDSGCYPVEWSVTAPEKNINWTVTAIVDDQLMQTGITYWEGAVNVTDTSTGKMLGRGYLEMSGYE